MFTRMLVSAAMTLARLRGPSRQSGPRYRTPPDRTMPPREFYQFASHCRFRRHAGNRDAGSRKHGVSRTNPALRSAARVIPAEIHLAPLSVILVHQAWLHVLPQRRAADPAGNRCLQAGESAARPGGSSSAAISSDAARFPAAPMRAPVPVGMCRSVAPAKRDRPLPSMQAEMFASIATRLPIDRAATELAATACGDFAHAVEANGSTTRVAAKRPLSVGLSACGRVATPRSARPHNHSKLPTWWRRRDDEPA